jgi:hypothetical protein
VSRAFKSRLKKTLEDAQRLTCCIHVARRFPEQCVLSQN